MTGSKMKETAAPLTCNIVVIGGGPAGLAAAIAAREAGEQSILILERDEQLGGILNQCIHNGFGLHTFKEELTGPEYAQRFIDRADELGIERKLSTMAVDVSQAAADSKVAAAPEGAANPKVVSECDAVTDSETATSSEAATGTGDSCTSAPCGSGYRHVVTAVNATDGLFQVYAKAVVLAMGCRERPRGALNIPGYRPAGIYSAGTAQYLVNIEGQLPGREVVILGSGDIGLIMARRMTLEGAHVACVAEIMPYSGGLKRNIVQCLDDFSIPLLLSHTVVGIEGKRRVEAVTIAQVDEHLKPIPGTEVRYPCDTLLLSVGLLPENELSREAGVRINPVTRGAYVNESLETSVSGIFACGNVLHVHDLVDYVSQEAATAGKRAAEYVQRLRDQSDLGAGGGQRCGELRRIPISAADGVRYTVPSSVALQLVEDRLTVRFRVGAEYRDRFVSVYAGDERISHRKKRVLAPGEMEQVDIPRSVLVNHADAERIVVKLEER